MGGVFRVLKDKRCGLVNRHGTRAGSGVRRLPGVQHAGIEAKIKFFHAL